MEITKDYFAKFAVKNHLGQTLMPARVPYPGKDWIVKKLNEKVKSSPEVPKDAVTSTTTTGSKQLQGVVKWVVKLRKGEIRLFGLDDEGQRLSDVPLPAPSKDDDEDVMYEIVVVDDNEADSYFTLGGDSDMVSCRDFTEEALGLTRADAKIRLPGLVEIIVDKKHVALVEIYVKNRIMVCTSPSQQDCS